MPSNKQNFKVSICLLTYNHDHLIAKVIDSIIKQTFKDYELIISDDCSKDNTWEIITDYAKNGNIKAVRTPENLGMAGNTNYSASFAQGKYLAILHDDDLIAEDLLEKWVNVAERYENIGFVFNDYLDGNSVASHAAEGRDFKEIMEGKRFLHDYLFNSWGCPVRGTTLIKRECFIALNGMDTRFGLLADVDLWMRLSARWDVGYVNESLIKLITDRKGDYPEDYPEDYTNLWKRTTITFNIHANNLIEENFDNKLIYWFNWFRFRIRVSLDVIKLLLYAIVKQEKEIIINSADSVNKYEFCLVKVTRNILLKVYDKRPL